MLCSIIIPLYNKEKFIQIALDSVLNQTYQRFEIIVVDDGSRDTGPEIVLSNADQRIRLIRQTNAGVSRARNRGIEEARGDLVFFLDADDWYDDTFLQTILNMAAAYPSGSCFATDFKLAYEYRAEEWRNTEQLAAKFETVDNFYQRRYLTGPFIHTNSVAAWRKDLDDLQPCFPVGESLGEDQDFQFRLTEKLQLVYCPKKLVAYRFDVPGGLCSTESARVFPPAFARLDQRARLGLIKGPGRAYARLISTDERTSVARRMLINGQRFSAMIEICKAYRAAVKRRWWITLFMCFFAPAEIMRKWDIKWMKKLQIQ
ncbi:glycosyltransferase involved in cell wall biosynthesis [Oxalobacteraceae bacterium GrIS 2.11]